VVTGSREGGDVRGSPITAIMVLTIRDEYISRSYSRSSPMICLTPTLAVVSKPVLCPLAGIHKSRALIE